MRAVSALTRPSSSSTPGRSRRAIRRISSSEPRVISWTWRSSPRSGSGAWSATRFSSRRTAVRVCPTSSCSSWATLRRSASWAESARALLVARSASRRSSIVLNVSISAAISPCPATSGRGLGRSRSVVVIARVTRWRGKRPSRSRAALAASMKVIPPVRIIASVSRTGVEMVIGPSNSRAPAATSTAALSRKIRQNRDKGARPPSGVGTIAGVERAAGRGGSDRIEADRDRDGDG